MLSEQDETYNRGLTLFEESLHKPDHALRACARNQTCLDELLQIRDHVLEYTKSLRRKD
ncbi:MAG: hypothetical protein CM15mV36_2120 [Caudoviricetes sp.]|jgi:hypothetical protein|nr:MAG: hypothetical protein CM15mV36_2120 [Caudoviricetes sp.]